MIIKTIASGSAGNGYHISDGVTEIVLEAGVRFDKLQKFLEFRTRKIKAVLVTHEHLDHAKYVKDYLQNGLDCYMTRGTKAALQLEHHRLNTIHYKEMIRIGTLSILPFPTEHDVNEPCGFLIQSDNGSKLLFATDTYYIRYVVSGLTHILLEVNHDYDYMMENVEKGKIHDALAQRIMRSHLNLENAIKWLKSQDLNELKEIHLIHLSDSNSKAQEFKQEIQKVTGVPVYIAR